MVARDPRAVQKDEDKDTESIPLSALHGATLRWEDRDGTVHRVEFD